MARTKPRRWVGVDGEGVGRSPHRYTLLAWSDAAGRQDWIEDSRGLSTADALGFLLSTPRDARVAGYYLGYDWTKILADLPDAAIYRLFRPELRELPADEGRGFSRVRWRDFRLHYLSGMMRIQRGDRAVTVWDLGKFYQASFVDSLKAWGISADVEAIADMKDQRSDFDTVHSDRIRGYCLAECRALAELAEELEAAHREVDLCPRSWYGPGSTASVALDRLGIADKRGEHPAEVLDAADRAFFGGRFEHSAIGTFDDVHGYDITSAYPYHQSRLPCLEHARWERVTRERDLRGAKHALIRFELRDIGAREPWGPLPVRLASGTIVFPRGGASGWVWRDEWEAARAGWSGVRWGGEAWALRSDCDCRPFEKFAEWYAWRVELGKCGKGRVVKYVINSGYGKVAQRIGRPKYHSVIWAGMITSGTRAQLLRLLCRHRDRRAVLALATDGLYSLEHFADVPDKCETLGGWEHKAHGRMTFVRPGIYWSHDGATAHTRGFSKRQLVGDPRRKVPDQRPAVLDAIARGLDKAPLGTSNLFGGAKACVYRTPDGEYHRSRYFGEWHDVPAAVSLAPAPKRGPGFRLHKLDGVESAGYAGAQLSDDARALRALATIFWANR